MGLLEVSDRAPSFVPVKAGEVFQLGGSKIRILEDGSNTDNRLSSFEITLAPNTAGPPPHWHEMHDESFLVTKGTVRFHVPGKPDIDAQVGDYIVLPTRSPHTFSNPTDEEARFFCTCSPSFYVNYFKLLGEFIKQGTMSREKNAEAMAYFATIPVPEA